MRTTKEIGILSKRYVSKRASVPPTGLGEKKPIGRAGKHCQGHDPSDTTGKVHGGQQYCRDCQGLHICDRRWYTALQHCATAS
ncbi:hypothetical protein J6590_059529 [Homalodisca vitripennis]|nr:hypothetical protein J6590_059529 [Homalodisca vitripennis]